MSPVVQKMLATRGHNDPTKTTGTTCPSGEVLVAATKSHTLCGKLSVSVFIRKMHVMQPIGRIRFC